MNVGFLTRIESSGRELISVRRFELEGFAISTNEFVLGGIEVEAASVGLRGK